MRGDLGERGETAFVAFDRDHLFGALRKERARKPSRARPDLDDRYARERTGGAGDPPGQVEIEKEVLTERFSGIQSVRGDDLAQRRQSVRRQRHGASRAASLSAAIRLDGLARPRPAMSNAVP